jgi:hypothetical protein
VRKRLVPASPHQVEDFPDELDTIEVQRLAAAEGQRSYATAVISQAQVPTDHRFKPVEEIVCYNFSLRIHATPRRPGTKDHTKPQV